MTQVIGSYEEEIYVINTIKIKITERCDRLARLASCPPHAESLAFRMLKACLLPSAC